MYRLVTRRSPPISPLASPMLSSAPSKIPSLPSESSPQHLTVPSPMIAQVWWIPEETEEDLVVGRSAVPSPEPISPAVSTSSVVPIPASP